MDRLATEFYLMMLFEFVAIFLPGFVPGCELAVGHLLVSRPGEAVTTEGAINNAVTQPETQVDRISGPLRHPKPKCK